MQHIDLAHGLQFLFGRPTFESKGKPKACVGHEFLTGSVRIAALDQLFPNHKIVFFPLFGSELSWAAIIRNVVNQSSVLFEKIILDLPKFSQPFMKPIVESFPENVCLIANENFESGLYFEALEGFRIVLNLLAPDWKNVVCAGEADFSIGKPQNESLSTMLALQNGLLPFLQIAFDNLSSPMPPNLLFTSLLAQLGLKETQPTLVMCQGETLVGLSLLIEKRLKDVENNPELFLKSGVAIELAQARKTMLPSQDFVLSRVDAATASDLSENAGFLVREFQNHNTLLQNGLDIFRQGLASAFQNAAKRYADWTRLSITKTQERDTFRFAYRLALEANHLLPTTFDMVLATQSAIDSNFAFEFLKECRDFPSHKSYSQTLPTLNIPLEKVFKHVAKMSVSRFETLQRRSSPKRVMRGVPEKQNQTKSIAPVSEEKYADNSWVNTDHPYSCSFPTEDIFMENFSFQCRDAVIEKVRAQQTVISELQSTMGEGLDIRETVRNWHQQKIMIREELQVGKADVGTIVFNFVDDNEVDKYSWKTLWLAESHDKSHLMFFATPFANELIGPGIAKSEFGGFAVIPIDSFPVNAWDDAFIKSFCETPAEALIVAGALVTEHKSVLYIANKPPSQRVTDLLKRSGRSILYHPLAEFSSDSVRRIRTFHILAEAGVRGYADKYIRKPS